MRTTEFLKLERVLQSQSKNLNVEFINIKFTDVIGLEEAKREAQEVVALIKDRSPHVTCSRSSSV